MSVDKIDVTGDSRIRHETATVNGRRYHYLLGEPQGEQRGTLFLIHGWPDLSMGWRYQIPMFLEMGLRVVAPDLMGFGRTEAPEPLEDYSLKRAAHDIHALAQQLGCRHIFLGGHDWGGAVVHRVCNHLPGFVTHVFSVCTPYIVPAPPDQPYVSLEERVRTVTPNFGYQIQLASGDVEKRVTTRDDMRQFLCGAYGGTTPDKEHLFDMNTGAIFDRLDKIGPSLLLEEKELEYYVDEYMRNGIHGTLNWYRTGEINHNGDKEIKSTTINIPSLFILAKRDAALPKWMSAKMEQYMPQLTRRAVDTNHWALWEQPAEVNAHIKEWLEPFVKKHVKSKM